MRKHVLRILGLLFLLLPVSLGAQEMSVKDFFLAQTDLTANTRGTMVYDQNGEVCALIKLETSLDGFTFDVGSLGVTEVKRVGGELWIYVPFGIRRITISHPQLGVIRDFRFPIAIEKARTYIMKLNASLGSRVYDNSKKQTFKVHIEPKEATFEINGMSMPLDADGNLKQEMSFGTYDISVTHPDYHSFTTEFTIDDPNNPQELVVKLKQNFGWIVIPAWDGETLWLDDKETAYTYGDTLKIRSGHYRLKLKKPNYKAYESSVEVKDSLLVDVNPGAYELWAKRLNITVPEDGVGIYLDTIKIGEGVFNGFIEYGSYLLSARKRGCRPTQKNITVGPRSQDTYLLEVPMPAYGTLNVTTDPAAAEVYIDNEYVGSTPGLFRLAVDDHKVSLRKKGFDTEFFDVIIQEDEEYKLDIRMMNTLTVKIVTEKPGAKIWVDGKEMGETPLDTRVEAGVRRVKAVQEGYKDFDKDINFDNPRTYTLSLNPKYSRKFGFYIDAQAAFPLAVGGGIGFMIKNFNLEFNGLYGLQASDPVYWNSAGATSEPSVFTYKPIIAGARLGWEIPVGRAISIIPRAGANLVAVKGTPQSSTVSYNASQCSSIAAVVDVKTMFRLARVFYITVVPEFDIAVKRSDLYKAIADTNKTVAGWDSGFHIKAGICLLF